MRVTESPVLHRLTRSLITITMALFVMIVTEVAIAAIAHAQTVSSSAGAESGRTSFPAATSIEATLDRGISARLNEGASRQMANAGPGWA